MADLKQYKSDAILFIEAGFIAVNQMDENAALQLFKAAEAIEPKNLLPKIGFGYLHLCKMDLKEAVKSFQDVLAKDPENQMAKAFLGLSTVLNPSQMAKGEKLLAETEKESADPAVKKLAKDALHFVDVYLKKAPSPAASHAKKAKPKPKPKKK